MKNSSTRPSTSIEGKSLPGPSLAGSEGLFYSQTETSKSEIKMKKLSIVGGILFALGMLVATGIDVNPIQILYSLALICCAAVCFSLADRTESAEKTEGTESAKSIKLKMEDAA